MSEEDDELEKWRKSKGISDEEMQRLLSPELRWLRLFEKLTERVDLNDEESRRRDDENRRRAEATQRSMDFIVQQQAQFTADMQQLRESQSRAEQRWEQTGEGVRSLLSIAEIHEREIMGLAEGQGRLSEGQARLAEAQARLAEAQNRTDRQIAETNEQMAETNERLNALINTVERFISERRNGGQQNS